MIDNSAIQQPQFLGPFSTLVEFEWINLLSPISYIFSSLCRMVVLEWTHNCDLVYFGICTFGI